MGLAIVFVRKNRRALYKLLAGKLETKRPLAQISRRCEDNAKIVLKYV
jgi:hypothetical protein